MISSFSLVILNSYSQCQNCSHYPLGLKSTCTTVNKKYPFSRVDLSDQALKYVESSWFSFQSLLLK